MNCIIHLAYERNSSKIVIMNLVLIFNNHDKDQTFTIWTINTNKKEIYFSEDTNLAITKGTIYKEKDQIASFLVRSWLKQFRKDHNHMIQ